MMAAPISVIIPLPYMLLLDGVPRRLARDSINIYSSMIEDVGRR
jgi:hypothetical protein